MMTRWLSVFAKRFVAGETAEMGVAAAKRMNGLGIKAILDFLGEAVMSAADARAAADEYIRLIGLIQASKADSQVSVKLSQMGLLVSLDVCFENMGRVLAAASKAGPMVVWVDMEGSALTQRTIEAFEKLRLLYPNVGLCVQAYLVRTGGDLDRLMRSPLNVRLCKGAYKEPPSIALATKRAVDGNYRMLVQKLFEHVPKGVFPAFATHDRFLIDYVLAIAKEKQVQASQFEFEMLYGIQNRLLESFARRGFQTRVYIPYGSHWLPYFVRRLRERKENALFLIKNLFHR